MIQMTDDLEEWFNRVEKMRETLEDQLSEGRLAQEELRLLREGHRVLIPCDIEHARSMFKMATYYLSQYDKEFTLTMEMK